MSELPQITPTLRVSDHTGMKSARTPRSVDHLRRSSASSITKITYAQRFHYITKIVNYNEMNDQQVWRQYEKLRECLKILNEEILSQMQKKAVIIRKPDLPKSKTQQQILRLMDQQFKVNETVIRAKKDELASTEGRIKYLTKQGIREQLQVECEQVIQTIAKLKVQNKNNRRKTKILARDLVTAPQQLLEKLLNLEEQLVYADRRAHKLKKRVIDSDKIVAQSIEKFNEITNAIQSRLEQYKVVEHYVQEQINVQTYQELKSKQENMKKYESPLKRNYLLKLKDLDVLVSNINHHDKVITQSEQSILAMRAEIDSIGVILHARRPSITQQKNYAKPLKYKQNLEESNRRHASMMEIRETDDKNNENSTLPTPLPEY